MVATTSSALKYPQSDRAIFTSRHEQSVRLLIECHGLGSLHRGNDIQWRVVIGGILMEREDVAIAGGIKNRLGGGIEDGCVHLFADGVGGDHFAVVGVEHGHHFASATEKEAAILRVERQAGRGLAGSDLPAILYGECFCVNAQQFTLVFEVDEDVALSVGNGKLRAAAQGDRSGNAVVLRVDYRRAFTVAVHREDAFRGGVVDDGVRLLAYFHFANSGQGLEIENDHGVHLPGGNEPPSKFWGHRNAMNSGQIGYFPDHVERIRIQNDNLRGVRYVQTAGRLVHGQVVPSALARKGNLFEDVIAGWVGCKGGETEDCRQNDLPVLHDCFSFVTTELLESRNSRISGTCCYRN